MAVDIGADGTLETLSELLALSPGFDFQLGDDSGFGKTVAALGDLDGDGTLELAVGRSHGGASLASGVVWILSLRSDGSVARDRRITEGEGGFVGDLDANDGFGYALAPIGDIDGNGVADLAVTAPQDDDAGTNSGCVWLLLLNGDATVAAHVKLPGSSFGTPTGFLGSSVCAARRPRR